MELGSNRILGPFTGGATVDAATGTPLAGVALEIGVPIGVEELGGATEGAGAGVSVGEEFDDGAFTSSSLRTAGNDSVPE